MILENFMPPGIHCNLVHEQIDDFPLTEQERDLTAQWRSNKRLLEFHQGRSAAKLGLQQAGFAAAHYSILPDASGCPIWPSDYCGSISHTSQCAVAVVAKRQHYAALGIDVENKNKPRSIEIQSKIASPREQQWIQNHQRNQLENLIRLFSAKEAIYKAVYSLTGERLTWQDADLAWDTANSTFDAEIKLSSHQIHATIHSLVLDHFIISGIAFSSNYEV